MFLPIPTSGAPPGLLAIFVIIGLMGLVALFAFVMSAIVGGNGQTASLLVHPAKKGDLENQDDLGRLIAVVAVIVGLLALVGFVLAFTPAQPALVIPLAIVVIGTFARIAFFRGSTKMGVLDEGTFFNGRHEAIPIA